MASILLLASVVTASFAYTQEALPRENVAELETAAHRFYDELQGNDWAAATAQLQIISKVAKPVIFRFDEAGMPLTNAVVRSARAVRQHDRTGALHAANKIMEWTALDDAAARPGLPPEVARLGYLAREIQIEIGDSNDKKLAARITEARQCWEKIRPLLEKLGYAVVVADGEDIIHRLETGETPEDAVQAQEAFPKFVGRIEAAFSGPKL